MFPVISIESECCEHDDDGQIIPNSLYTRDDIERIVRQQRLRLVRPDAIGWVVKLANLHGWGRLRLAVRVLEIAIDIKQAGQQVSIDDLRDALKLFIGPSDAKLVHDAMETQYEMRSVAAG